MIGLFIGWLRYYHKIELLTSALNVYVDDNKKISNIKEYIKSQGIEIKGIKFGKSKAQYFMDKGENAIYQGISSIKYCNDQIADELYELSKIIMIILSIYFLILYQKHLWMIDNYIFLQH